MVFITKILSSLYKIIFQKIGFLNLRIFQNPKNIIKLSWNLLVLQNLNTSIIKGSHDHSYSTCKILKVLHPKDWGQELFKPKSFPINFQTKLDLCRSFSYWDYEQAWFNTFLIQNNYRSHSWLFFLSDHTNISRFPAWFTRWWNNFGPISDIFPYEIRNGFELFEKYYKPSDLEKKFSFLCLYCTKFFVPWVFQWYLDYSFNNGIIILQRKFKVKW